MSNNNVEIDNYDLEKNILYIRGIDLILLTKNNDYLQNAWFALTGNLLDKNQLYSIIQQVYQEIQTDKSLERIKHIHQAISGLSYIDVTRRFMIFLSEIDSFVYKDQKICTLTDAQCLKIILLLPWLISIACSYTKYIDFAIIEKFVSYEEFFWSYMAEQNKNIDMNMISHFMSLLMGGFGVVTPTTAALRFISSTKNSISYALMGSLCAAGPSHMGACKEAALRLLKVKTDIIKGNIENALINYCNVKPYPGFGHPIMPYDTRVEFFFSYHNKLLAYYNDFVELLKSRTKLNPNVDFLIAVMVNKYCIDPQKAILAFFCCRAPILLAHYRSKFNEHAFGISSKEIKEKYKKVPKTWI